MDPHGSGIMLGSGGAQRPGRRPGYVRRLDRRYDTKVMPRLPLAHTTTIKREIPDFDPKLEQEYTPYELILLAEKILLLDESPGPHWLNMPQLKDRWQHEIYNGTGMPEPSMASGLYWRTHPEGRPWRTKAEMKESGGGFYK